MGELADPDVKILVLGDAFVGKSKIIDRFINDEYTPHRSTTSSLTIHTKEIKLEVHNGSSGLLLNPVKLLYLIVPLPVHVEFWDLAGEEPPSSRLSFYYRAHCCILVFDVTQKSSYQSLPRWYEELRQNCPDIPCILAANKVDADDHLFQDAILNALRYKATATDLLSEVLQLLNEQHPVPQPTELDLEGDIGVEPTVSPHHFDRENSFRQSTASR